MSNNDNNSNYSSDTDFNDDDDIITAESVAGLCDQLIQNDPIVMEIEFFYQDMAEEAIAHICEALQHNFMVDSIVWEGCGGLTLGSTLAIRDMLRVNRRVRHLILNENRDMGPDGIISIMEGLQENRKLTAIMLEGVSLEERGLHSIARMLQVNTTLRELSLGRNSIPCLTDVANSLRLNQTLTRLELGYCDLVLEDVQLLFECIQNHSSLSVLDLTANNLDSDIAESLGSLLRRNQSLKNISIANNNLGPGGAAILALALEDNTTLEHLVMSSNGIGDGGAQALCWSLPHMKGIRELYLLSNDMTVQGYNYLVEGMKNNKSLNSIFLHGGTGPSVPLTLKKKIKFYARRNVVGWPTLDYVYDALWPHILGRISKNRSMLHFFLLQTPGLLSQRQPHKVISKTAP